MVEVPGSSVTPEDEIRSHRRIPTALTDRELDSYGPPDPRILVCGCGGSGNNTLDVKIQSDTSGYSSPSDRLTFTQLNQGSGATFETQTATGPAGSDNIWRVVVTIAGAGSRSFKFIVGFGYYVT